MNHITAFTSYLQKRGFHPQTIYAYTNKLQQYFDWCHLQSLDANTTSLDDLYHYKRYCLEQGLKVGSTRQRLSVIKHYFHSIRREENPALLVKHKKRMTRLPKNLLSDGELKELYRTVRADTFIQKRDKVMIGLVIFQGLKREEIEKLEIHHLNLEQASIYIPSSTRTNSRNVDLHPLQMHHLLSYFYEYRPKLLLEAKKDTARLFFSMGKSSSINNPLQRKIVELKWQYPSFSSLTQIKKSRMALWVGEYGIRKAQYLSGIRYTSSMLRYKSSSIEKLKQKLSIVHPMERLAANQL